MMLMEGLRINSKRGIERSALAGTGGARDQDHALRQAQHRTEPLFNPHRKAELGQILQRGITFEQAHHDFFAILGGQGGYSQINAAAADFHQEPAVLRSAAFGDIHVRKDFDARGDGILQGFGNALVFAQHTVHAETDGGIVGMRLDVNVAGSALGGGLDHGGDEHDGGSGPGFLQEFGLHFPHGFDVAFLRAGGDELHFHVRRRQHNFF